MQPAKKFKGIIFDMDNTLLSSAINFDAMREEIFAHLTAANVLPADLSMTEHTSSTLIAHAQRTAHWNEELQRTVWDIAKKHEILGMENAALEPGVQDVLLRLNGNCKLAVLTNNSHSAAMAALTGHGIDRYFDIIIGREQMAFMKPAADGVRMIMNTFADIHMKEWLSIGDAWIDGKASQEAGVTFIAYNGNPDKMMAQGVIPDASINEWAELFPLLG